MFWFHEFRFLSVAYPTEGVLKRIFIPNPKTGTFWNLQDTEMKTSLPTHS